MAGSGTKASVAATPDELFNVRREVPLNPVPEPSVANVMLAALAPTASIRPMTPVLMADFIKLLIFNLVSFWYDLSAELPITRQADAEVPAQWAP